MRPGSPENSFGTQNAGVFGTKYWWWLLFCYNFTFPGDPSFFLASLFSPFFLPFPPFPPSSLFCPFPPLLPFPPFPSLPSRGVHDTLRWSCNCGRRSCFLSISRLYIFRGIQNCMLLNAVVPVLGHGGFSRETLIAVNRICSAKILCKPSLFKRENFFRSRDRPG